MKDLKQLASDGEMFYSHESEVVKQQLLDRIIEARFANSVGRQLVAFVTNQTKGHVYDIIVANGDIGMRKIADGSAYPNDVESYTKHSIAPVIWGNIITLTRNIFDAANFDLIASQLRSCGKDIAEKEDAVIMSAFGNATYGFPTATTDSTSHATTSNGTSLALTDLLGAAKLIAINNYTANKMVIHPNQWAELAQLDVFAEAHKAGNPGATEFRNTGFVARWAGMDVVSTKYAYAASDAYQSTTQYAYVLDSTESGTLVIRQPVSVLPFSDPQRNTVSARISTVFNARCLRPAAGVQITIS